MAERRGRHVPADPLEPSRSDRPFRAVTVRLTTGHWQLCVSLALSLSLSCLEDWESGQGSCLKWLPYTSCSFQCQRGRLSEREHSRQALNDGCQSCWLQGLQREGKQLSYSLPSSVSPAKEPPPRPASWCKQPLGTFSSFQVLSQHKPVLLLFPTLAACCNAHVITSQLNLEIFLLQVLAGSFPHNKDS